MAHFFFFSGLAFIMTHEMDAIRCKEWELFPGLSSLKEPLARFLFIILHVPLYVALFYYLWSGPAMTLNQSLITGLNIFFMIHVVLHLLMYRHPKNRFKSVMSWVLIVGAGVCGGIDLVW